MRRTRNYEYVIVGSGAGGGTLAGELARRGKHDVAIVERGEKEKIGTLMDSARYFDFRGYKDIALPLGLNGVASQVWERLGDLPRKYPMLRKAFGPNMNFGMARKSKEGTLLWRAMMLGGTTMVSCGNACRFMEQELEDSGVPISSFLDAAEQELGVGPAPEDLYSEATRAILRASAALGMKMEPMPKLVNPVRCTACGMCVDGCVHGAKWTALGHIREAQRQGADTICNTRVQKVLVENGKAKGVLAVGPDGVTEIRGDAVILAGGGLGTPVILQSSGIEAGSGLFGDMTVVAYGETDGLNQLSEPQMSVVDLEYHDSQGFLLSPFINRHRFARLAEVGPQHLRVDAKKMLGIVTKIADEPAGQVFPDGTVSKPVTAQDRQRLDAGYEQARKLLIEAGAHPDSVVKTRAQASHLGGTAAIGVVVDKNLQTDVDGLFVCDLSVFPASRYPCGNGPPPILSIVALAKYMATVLAP